MGAVSSIGISIMRFSAKHHSGFTLIELLITIAISGILTSIVFVGLRDEQQRSSTKDAADRLQIELIGLQNKIQSGIEVSTKYCSRAGGTYTGQGNTCTSDANCLVGGTQGRCVSGPPSGYGIQLSEGLSTYTLYADMPNGTTPADGLLGIGLTNDKVLASAKSLGTNIIAQYLRAETSSGSTLEISFSGSNGRAKIKGVGLCGSNCLNGRIVLKNTRTGVCYAITIDQASGIVSKRQFSSTCT